jgi:phosphatidylinositol-3-phosphatase
MEALPGPGFAALKSLVPKERDPIMKTLSKNRGAGSLASLAPLLLAALVAGAFGAAAGCGDDTSGTIDPGKGDGSTGSDGSTSGTDADPGDGGGPTGDGAAQGDGALAPLTTIFTIVMENHDYEEIVAPDGGPGNAPFLQSLIADYGLATNYGESGKPSLPNYLVMASGATQYPGVIDLAPTTFPFPVKKENLGTQLEAKKVPWRSYQESMGTPCNLASMGDYAPKHDPFLYFDDMQNDPTGLCAKTNVDFTGFPADLAAGTYRYMWITPNLINDGHNPADEPEASLRVSDAWAKTEVEKIMLSAAYKNGGVIFLTWDEAEGRDGRSGTRIPMIIVSPRIVSKGFKSNKPYTHKSYLATVEDILGLPRLATVTAEPNMMEFFK